MKTSKEHTRSKPLKGVLLIGGKSKRMGTDKFALMKKEKSLLQHNIELMRACGLEVYISCSAIQSATYNFDTPCIIDRFEDQGPLSGIYSAMEYLKSSVFILAVDYPFVRKETIEYMIDNSDNSKDASLYYTAGTKEWPCLCSVLEYSAFPFLKEYFESGQRSVRRFYESKLAFKVLDFDKSEFINLNTFEEYKKHLK